MNHRPLNKKSICLALSALIVVFTLSAICFLGQDKRRSVYDGHYIFDGKNAFTYEAVLSGDWEFYPDTLYYSAPKEDMPNPLPVQVPDNWIGHVSHPVPKTGNASYRLVIDGYVPFAGRSNIVLSLMGIYQDYAVYINGNPCHVRIPSPNGYPLYVVDAEGTVEVVIELYNSTTGLTLAPEIWAIGMHIGNIDTTRNVLLVIIPLFLILFLMFFIISFAKETHRLRYIALGGIITTIGFAVNILWASGYIDTINSFIRNRSIFLISILFRTAAAGWGILFFHKLYPEILSPKRVIITEMLLTFSFISAVTTVFLFHWYSGWYISYGLIIASFLLWMTGVIKRIGQENWRCVLTGISVILLFGSVAAAYLFDRMPNRKLLPAVWLLPAIWMVMICFIGYHHCHQEALVRMAQLLEMERLANKSQAAMLAGRIQPHFLYNTLLTLQELCRFDPEEASRVIVHFSNYLRHNIDFMNYTDLTPFEEEEKHIDNYIYIQKARFEDKLQYSADIQVRDFQIPPLTVQPLIENAVNYGVRRTRTGGSVHLAVYEDVTAIHIVVENTGPGFDPEKARTDHSLGNIRARLKTLLDADLIINSRENTDGTTVEIRIPKRRQI